MPKAHKNPKENLSSNQDNQEAKLFEDFGQSDNSDKEDKTKKIKKKLKSKGKQSKSQNESQGESSIEQEQQAQQNQNERSKEFQDQQTGNSKLKLKDEKSKIKSKDDPEGIDEEDENFSEDPLDDMENPEKVEDGQIFMLPQERQLDKKHPRYHFCRFVSRHYRLIESKRDRKNHFVRMQPVFVRYLHVLKIHDLPLVTIDTFRKYFKKFFKRRGIKYEQTTNRVDMKVVVGIDRRYNSKFEF